MSPGLAWRHVILPQALRRVGPALVLNLVELLKDSSLCSVLAVMELTRQFTAAAQSTRSLLELGLMVGLLYLGLARLGGALSRHLQRRLGLG
jgi:polar amino acid transport system substrate-binding protein